MSPYEAVLQKLRRNRITAAFLVLGVAAIATGQFTGALKDIWEFISGVMPDGPAYTLDDEAFRRGEAESAVGHHARAVESFRKSAESGNPLAGAALAWMYGNGRGVPNDREWARYWAEQALTALTSLSDVGNPGAQFYLGRLFDLGVGCSLQEGCLSEPSRSTARSRLDV
jgi:TPR repeat protein